ncbi:MAG: serine/threonine protein kinase [Xanthomonadales bacterium]|nr:serine/threonine protein kinase [Xanthomonadales bacterium]
MTTSPDRWSRISALFDELVELDSDRRTRRLAQLAASDPELVEEVRALLAADEDISGLLDGDAAAAVPGMLSREGDGMPADGMAGPYRLLRLLGEGGMGMVWLGERTDGAYEQQVAVKVLKRGMDTHAILRRFLQERRILARLNHAHIVRLLDGGMTADGRPFYVMDHVDGAPITEHARRAALDPRARVSILVKVADAVAYAHTQLIVHRDLKPSNVLVDHQGEPRVLDFGIAKLIEESGEQTRTGTAMRVLSPAYAAPEQILGEAIGTPTDVYALGLMLCELLTGQLPRQRRDTNPSQLALDASLEVVERASTLAAKLDAGQLRDLYGAEADAQHLARNLAGDLDLIIATALQREPARRYATAAAFAEDLRRWLDARPITARADSAAYRLRKFVHRHRFGVAASVVVVLALLAGLGAALWQARIAQAEARRADSERDKAELQLARSERVKEFILALLGEQDPLSRASATARSPRAMIRDGISIVDASLAGDPALQAQLFKDLGEIQVGLDDREAAQATLKRAWEMQSELSGANSIAAAEAMAAYADAVYAVGEVAKAETLIRDALQVLRVAGAGDLPRAALAESTLANIELTAGRNAEAEALARHGVDVFRTVYGASHVQVAARLGVLGKVQQEAGRYPDALESYAQALSIVARNNGEAHVRTATLRTSIGDILRVQRKYDEAQHNYETALRIERESLPADHLYIGGTLLRLGDLQRRTGRLEEAERSFAESLAILGKTPSGQYAQALQTHGNLARAQGKFDLAVQRYRKAFEVFREATGDSVYTWLTALLEVAAMTEAGHYREADARALEAVTALQRISPEDEYNNTYAASVLGNLRQAEGRHGEAIPHFRRALAGVQKIYGADHIETAQVRIALASSLIASEVPAALGEAESLIDAVFVTLNRKPEPENETTLGCAYLERGRLHLVRGHRQAANADIGEALKRLDVPEYAPKLRQAQALARKLAAR